jgi:hypothetical protein
MGQVSILDTGKLYVGGSVATGEARAYGDTGEGTALNLKNAEASLNFEVMTPDDSPIIRLKDNSATGYFQFGEADSMGVQLPTWTIRGYVNRTDSDDMVVLGRLIFMCQTKGYKELYSATNADWSDIIAYSKYGEREYNGETTKTVSYINVRIKTFSVTQTADKKGFNYTLNLVETN